MRKLDINEFKLCQILGRIFEKSLLLSSLSSPMFIRRFMTNEQTKCFFDKSYLSLSSNEEDIIYEINSLYKDSENKIKYSEEQMYWIGYIYGAISFLYGLSSKSVYKLFPAFKIVKYYRIYHTFDIEIAAERMMESINYNDDYTARGVAILKRLFNQDKLKEMINHPAKVDLSSIINIDSKDDILFTQVDTNPAYVILNGNNLDRKDSLYLVIGLLILKDTDILLIANKDTNLPSLTPTLNELKKKHKAQLLYAH